MLNVDTLVAFGLLQELKEKSANGVMPLSQATNYQAVQEKIVYDDSKPKKVDEHMTYPVVYDASIDGDDHHVNATYDTFVEGLTVKYCVHDDPELCFVNFCAEDNEGSSVNFVIRNGNYYLGA